MKAFMEAHGICEAIEPVDPKAAVKERVDKVALAAIYQAIPKDVLLSVAEKKTAKGAWEAIKTMSIGADRVKRAKVQTLRAEFEIMSMKYEETIDEFSMKLSALAVGSLKEHEERLGGLTEKPVGQLMLTEEEWEKRKSSEGRLLLYREEWLKRSNKSRGTSSYQGQCDKSKVRCFNCQLYGHYTAKCRKPRKEKKKKLEVNLAQIQDDEPSLLLTELEKVKNDTLLLNEKGLVPKL
ncbi:hypothetical protein AgCh_033241 [Apium graveolens]